MLSLAGEARQAAESAYIRLRTEEFSRLDEERLCYLDYTGAAIPARSQLQAAMAAMTSVTFGNPHSAHVPSRRSTQVLDGARQRVLDFLDAPADEYEVCFTANCSAAIKLVAEAYPFDGRSSLVLSADNHNSVNGVAEYARRAGARVRRIALDGNLHLRHPQRVLDRPAQKGSRLFAYPAQSNFSGVRHPLPLVETARAAGYDVLLDAAALLPTHPLSLREVPADFLVMSMYKLFGFPTGIGALVARRAALGRLQRPWFAGGTVDWVSVRAGRHRAKRSIDRFEDGTPNFACLAAVDAGFDFLETVGRRSVVDHVHRMTHTLLRTLGTTTHRRGQPMFRVYGPADMRSRGGTVAFNVLNASGAVVPYEHVERHAAASGIAIRGGCFCNPGAAEAALSFPPVATLRCLDALSDREFSPRRLGECLGGQAVVGALRASVGIPTTLHDIERAIDVIAGCVSD